MGNNITQKLKYKESVVKFSYKYGVTKAAIKYQECRRTIYRWRERYDGSLKSLEDKSRRPHYHPNQHTEAEIQMIKNYKANNKETGLVVLWVKLRKAGYTRTVQSLYHVLQKMGIYKKAPSKKKGKQPLEWTTGVYPGDKIQVDVKFVPQECMTEELKEKGEKYYQYNLRGEYMNIVMKTEFPDLKLIGRGKVRDIYDLDDKLLIVSTDRLSAFDVILPNGIEGKGEVLTELSTFWFDKTSHIVKNHLITTKIEEMPAEVHKYKDILEGRSMLVKKAKPLLAECVVRGYITGSGMKDYLKTGAVCGIKLPAGLQEADKLPSPIFTPSTKADVGHDESISYEKMCDIVGKEYAEKMRDYTIKIYTFASELALSKGIIIADTKLEFGLYENEVILIDEVLTPDSSRFWFADKYKSGHIQDSMDKQIVRNYLETLDWDKKAPGPVLPENISKETSKRYREIAGLLTAE